MICALAMLTAMMPSAVWAETPVPETTVITEEASEPTATPAATDSTEQPADNSGETPVASPLPTDQEQPATATDTGDAQPAETPAASPAPTATPVPAVEEPAAEGEDTTDTTVPSETEEPAEKNPAPNTVVGGNESESQGSDHTVSGTESTPSTSDTTLFAENPVAQIGDTPYATLDEAVKAAEDGATIELLADATTEGMDLSKSLTIQAADGLETMPTLTFTKNGIALWGKALTFRNLNVVMNGIGSTPYVEWGWMTICASKDASLTLDNTQMVMDATGASGQPHAIYFCSNNKLTLQNHSSLKISNYPNDALEWDGGDGGYNVNITDSTFVSDHNRSGFTGTFTATIKNSQVDVINSLGNGSNGSHFAIENSTVNFNDNGSHGLSAGALHVTNSTVNAFRNKGMGISVNNELIIADHSVVTVSENAFNATYGYAAVRLYNNFASSLDSTSSLIITDNHNTGLYIRQGSFAVEDGATLRITGNDVSNNLLDGYGGGLYVGYGDNYDPTVTLPASAEIYNNHATQGGDDIYVSTGVNGPKLTFSTVGSDWILDDDNRLIDGWYDDSEGSRWDISHLSTYHVVPFTAFTNNVATVTGLTSLKAAYTETAVLQPADMTIYMGGEHGYEGVSEENGTISGSNSLPEPGYYITLPDSVNEALKNAGLIVDGAPANLSQYLTIHTVGSENNYTWTLTPYGNTYSAAFNKYIYAIVPGDNTSPFRLNFTDADGNVTTSDEFAPAAEGSLHNEYTMDVYPGLVDLHQVIIEVTLPDGTSYCCTMDTEPGKLNVRYVTGSQESVVTPAYTDIAQASLDDDPTKPALNNAYVIKDADTRFFINGSDVDVNENGFAQVSLLFDDIVSNTNTEGVDDYATMLTNKTLEIIGDGLENVQFQAKCVNLLDCNKGSVWLTPRKEVTR